ncbi:MAG: hypothetical protein HPY60_09175 [Candidatus Methanofastidiosum sp.]|nr:hypothetical protein [Methanofastidiosum sp.]
MSSRKYIVFLIPIAVLVLSACLSTSPKHEMQTNDESLVGHPEADPAEVVARTYALLKDKIDLKIDKVIYSKENGVCVISLVSGDFSPLSSNEDSYYKDCCTIASEVFKIKEIDAVILPYLEISKTGGVEIEASYGIERKSPIKNYWEEIFRVKDYKKTVEFFFTDMKTNAGVNNKIINREA